MIDALAQEDVNGDLFAFFDLPTLQKSAQQFFEAPLRQEGDTLILDSALQEEPYRMRITSRYVELFPEQHNPFQDFIDRRYAVWVAV